MEVKSTAYIQSWKQKELSKSKYGIAPTKQWDRNTGAWVGEKKRQADVYIFCLLDHKCGATIDVLNINQWKFFIAPTTKLNARSFTQKSITHGSLSRSQKHFDCKNG
ncbi:MAG: hypothetical protein ACPG8W_08040 [Candidatus Promineifilaceae bacterium]